MKNTKVSTYDKQLGYVPAIPEPFWIRRWFGAYRPRCAQCHITFSTRNEWDTHYVLIHLEEDEHE